LKTRLVFNNGLVREPGWFPHKSAFFQAKALQKCDFYMEIVQKLKFPNNSINLQNATHFAFINVIFQKLKFLKNFTVENRLGSLTV